MIVMRVLLEFSLLSYLFSCYYCNIKILIKILQFLLSGDGFREYCSPNICDETNRCKINGTAVKDGQCVFVKSDFFEYFVKNVIKEIPGKYILVTHNGDLSVPDGQNDAPRIGMSKYITSDLLKTEYEKGRLISLYAQNLWWRNISATPRPNFTHCIPIGFENRQYKMGSKVAQYGYALQNNVIGRLSRTREDKDRLPLLLVAFYPKSRVPDRMKVFLDLLFPL
jgi:hypothetical protein